MYHVDNFEGKVPVGLLAKTGTIPRGMGAKVSVLAVEYLPACVPGLR